MSQAENAKMLAVARRLPANVRQSLLAFIWLSGRAPKRHAVKRLRRDLMRVLQKGDSERMENWLKAFIPVLEQEVNSADARQPPPGREALAADRGS